MVVLAHSRDVLQQRLQAWELLGQSAFDNVHEAFLPPEQDLRLILLPEMAASRAWMFQLGYFTQILNVLSWTSANSSLHGWLALGSYGLISRTPRWTPVNRPVVDGAKPASGSGRPKHECCTAVPRGRASFSSRRDRVRRGGILRNLCYTVTVPVGVGGAMTPSSASRRV